MNAIHYFSTLLCLLVVPSCSNKEESPTILLNRQLDTSHTNNQADTLSPLRPLNQLVDKQGETWKDIQKWISKAKNHIEILPKDSIKADSALFEAQITTRSPMGAIIYETGGILIDHGWLRILGSGSPKLNRSLMQWNREKTFKNLGEQPSFLLIADDIVGGFFAINAGGISNTGLGKIFYFAPDLLQWEPTDLTYFDFLAFAFDGDIELFYKDFRWKNWKTDIVQLSGIEAIAFYPPLYSKEGIEDINGTVRRPVPIQEIWDLHHKTMK